METILVASDDLDPHLQKILNEVSPDQLIETIGNVTSQTIGSTLWRAGYQVEYRHLDTLLARIEERCRVGSDFSAIVLSTIRPYKGMNRRLKELAEKIRRLDDELCLPSGVRVKAVPIVVALSLEMAGLMNRASGERQSEFEVSLPWCAVRKPGRDFAREVTAVINDWRKELYRELDYVGFALGFNEQGEIEISHALQRKRRESLFFNETAMPSGLQMGGLLLVPEQVSEQMQTFLELRDICANLEATAARHHTKPELYLHQFLDRHPQLLYRGFFAAHWSEQRLGPQTQPDFVLMPTADAANTRHWEVLEMKRPDVVLLRRRQFAEAVVKGLKQLRRYQQVLQSSGSQQRQQALLATVLHQPRYSLLIGRSFDPAFAAEFREVHAHSDFNDISIIQYDDLATPLWGRVQALKERLLGQIEGL